MRSLNFIDQVSIYVKAGNGGSGSVHLHRAKHVAKGGPDGGDGGRGGHVILKGNRNMSTLHHLRYSKHIIAGNGGNGAKDRRYGVNGKDVTIEVPLGTVINCDDTGKHLLEVLEHEESYVLLKAGRGGLGNDRFKSSTNQTPRYAQPGEHGAEMWINIELKLLGDAGLVGMPNSGKSTLLSVLSEAKPKIADYPFTTLEPQLGVVAYGKKNSFVLADIPGIIEGATTGKGLGLQFLRHIQRNSVLIFLVSADSLNIKKEYDTLLQEVGSYNKDLLLKPRLLVISKIDLCDSSKQDAIHKELENNVSCIFISAIKQEGLSLLKHKIWDILDSK